VEKENYKKMRTTVPIILLGMVLTGSLCFCGCAGYSKEPVFREDISTVYVEMFNNTTFQRGIEYELTDALAKRIESQTPYKIVTDRNRADSIISGKVTGLGESVYSVEQESGRALEKGVNLTAVVSWKDLKTGEMLIDNKEVIASSSYSEWQNQGLGYASSLAANRAAEKIAEMMEIEW
jgi:hypothetical protein